MFHVKHTRLQASILDHDELRTGVNGWKGVGRGCCENGIVPSLTVSIPVRVWQWIDATVDNTVVIDAADGNEESAFIGLHVRQCGWRAISSYSGDLSSIGWPPDDYPLSIVLHRNHWIWVRDELERWDEISSPDPDSRATESRRLITSALGAG